MSHAINDACNNTGHDTGNDATRERLLVLVVDDSELQLAFLKELLADQPFDFIVARNGVEALAAARRFRPGIVLLDIEMPLMDGIETVGALRAHADTAEVPVIMVTSRTGVDPLEGAFLGGCNEYVTKPVHKQELLVKIASLTGCATGDGLP